MLHKIIAILFFIATHYLVSQNLSADALYPTDFYTLKNQFHTMDHIRKKVFSRNYLSKAKQAKDSIKIAHGYYFLSELHLYDHQAIFYADSMINVSKHITNSIYPAEGYIQKGIELFHAGDFTGSLRYLLKALPIAKANDHLLQQITIKHHIAKLKAIGNNTEEALTIAEENVQLFNQKNLKKQYPFQYCKILYTLIHSYFETHQIAKAVQYIKEGLELTHQKMPHFYYNFLSCQGLYSYFLNDYKNALIHLQKVVSFAKSSPHALAKSHLYIHKCYRDLYTPNKGIHYLEKIDTLYKKHPTIVLSAKESYALLNEHYRHQGAKLQQILILQKVLAVDSLLKSNQKLNLSIRKNYEVPELISKEDHAINSLQKKSGTAKFYIIALVFLGILLLYLLWYTSAKNKQFKIRYEKLMSQNTEKQNIPIKTSSSQLTIDLSEDLVNDILKKLKLFEEKQHFIKNLTLNSLAKKLDTNSSYLSKIINHTQQTNFSNYINKLRVNLAIEKLKSEAIFRKYTIKAIANEVGFHSVQSFNSAFYKQTGISASFFIKQLNSDLKIVNK